MSKNKKDVKPISGRQLGELCRLLEERGVDKDIFQRTMLENPDGLCFFLRGRFGQLIDKELSIGDSAEGSYIRVVKRHTSRIGYHIVAVSRSIYDFAMGNILMIGDDAFKEDDVGKKQKIGNIYDIYGRDEGQIVVVVKSGGGISRYFLLNELSW